MDSIHLFNYDSENPKSINYGQFYWGIVLEDSRLIHVNADKMVVTDTGDLIAISNTRQLETESGNIIRAPREPMPLIALASGRWLSYYAASALTGEPVGLDNSTKYEEPITLKK
jgi:hypothetical protein